MLILLGIKLEVSRKEHKKYWKYDNLSQFMRSRDPAQ